MHTVPRIPASDAPRPLRRLSSNEALCQAKCLFVLYMEPPLHTEESNFLPVKVANIVSLLLPGARALETASTVWFVTGPPPSTHASLAEVSCLICRYRVLGVSKPADLLISKRERSF